MKKFVSLLLLLFAFIQTRAQSSITDTQWNKLMAYLDGEQWQKAADLSKSYLIKIPKKKTDGDDAATLRHMYITAEAGLMNIKQLTKEKAFKNVSAFTGHTIILSYPVTLKEGFNSVELLNKGKTDTLMISASNKASTDIFSFEYILPAKPIELDELKHNKGKVCRISGRLKLIKVEGLSFPHFRMIIDQASLEFKE